MTTSIYEAGDDRMVPDDDQMPEDDQMVPEELTADPAGAVVGDDPQSPASAVSEYPGTTVSAAGAQPRPARDSPLAIDSTRAAGRWNEIQAMFVDNPLTSVELAAGLADDSVEAHVRSVKERQHSLLSAWGGYDAGTEDLRVALQQYRAFWSRLEDFPGEAGGSIADQ
jgi:hypothetical protein